MLDWSAPLSFAIIWASACDFQQFDILTSVDSDEPVQPPFKLRNFKWRSVSSLTIKEYSSDKQRLWSDCAYAQAGLRLCWSHKPNCWKSHALAHIKPCYNRNFNFLVSLCGWWDWFESRFVVNPKDRFCRVEAQNYITKQRTNTKSPHTNRAHKTNRVAGKAMPMAGRWVGA